MLILRRLMVWPLGQTRSLSRSMGRERHERLPVLSELRMEHWSPVSLCAKLLRKTCRADKKLTRSYHRPPNKSLDASGGRGVFNQICCAEGGLVFAAGPTLTVCLFSFYNLWGEYA